SRGDKPGEGEARTVRAGFNGAAASKPRRQAALHRLLEHLAASMEPRLLSRGDDLRRRKQGVAGPASMEPRLLSRGDRSRGRSREGPGRASMEPRLLSRGDRLRTMAAIIRENPLQWSRGF